MIVRAFVLDFFGMKISSFPSKKKKKIGIQYIIISMIISIHII